MKSKVGFNIRWLIIFYSYIPKLKNDCILFIDITEKKYERYAFELYRTAQQHNKELTRKFFFIGLVFAMCLSTSAS